MYIPWPRVPYGSPMELTANHIRSRIKNVQYYQFPGTMTILCCITTLNGFNVVGEAHCHNAEKFSVIIGQDEAYKKAVDKIWPLEAYLDRHYEDINNVKQSIVPG